MAKCVNDSQLPVGKQIDLPVAVPEISPQATADAGAAANLPGQPEAGAAAAAAAGAAAGASAVASAAATPGAATAKAAAGADVSRFMPIRYNRKHIQQLAQTGATLGEIAALLGISAKKFSPANRRDFRRGRALLQQALRRQQLTLAAVKDPDLRLIFMLGKEYLKQGRDRPAATATREPEKTYLNVRMEEV